MHKDLSGLHKYMDKSGLPDELGGTLRIQMSAWVRFRIVSYYYYADSGIFTHFHHTVGLSLVMSRMS